ncbi:MAG: porin family protein [Muribaculaceae bacterium]|nr:porin family protein [Muribaculaceae bacterium]
MKRLLFVLFAFLGLATSAVAQKGDVTLGLQLQNATCAHQMGVGVNVGCFVSNSVRLEPSFNYYFLNAGLKAWDINLNAHYVFNVVERFRLYPLLGLTFSHWTADTDDSSVDRIGLNVGAGAEYLITDHISFKGEMKFQYVADFNQAVFSLGANYRF